MSKQHCRMLQRRMSLRHCCKCGPGFRLYRMTGAHRALHNLQSTAATRPQHRRLAESNTHRSAKNHAGNVFFAAGCVNEKPPRTEKPAWSVTDNDRRRRQTSESKRILCVGGPVITRYILEMTQDSKIVTIEDH